MDSGNNSSSLQSSSGGGDEEFDSRALFPATNTNANSNSNSNGNGNNNGFSISSANNVAASFPFLDSFSFLVPASPFPHTDPRGPAVNPAQPPKTPAPAPTLSSPRSSTTTTTTSSKKRSRASRRAPTTVLTTDTSNFRAMVQEFTGIPAPPFSPSSSSSASASPYPPPRSRFDFFNPAFNASPSPSFLLKPYPQKPFHLPNTSATSSSGISVGGSSINYNRLPPPPPSSANFGLSGSQSLLQSPLAARAQVMPSASTAAADYGSAGYLGQLAGAIGSGWGQDAGVDPRNLLRQVSNGACKLNYSGVGAAAAAAAEFGGDKGGEARGEGMVESWICSSD